MESNAIFNIKRFSGLFRTGIYRIKVSSQAILGFSCAFFSLILLAALLLNDVDKDNIRLFLIGLYQLGYIATLTFAAFRHQFNREKQIIWYMLPASAFEKRLFQALRVLVWNSILFIVIYFCIDHILWYYIYHEPDINNYYVGLKELFSFGAAIKGVPAWMNYTISFFFMAFWPIISSTISYPADMPSGKTPFKTYWLLFCVTMIIQLFFLKRTSTEYIGSIFKIILSSISLLYLLFDLTLAVIMSCRKDN